MKKINIEFYKPSEKLPLYSGYYTCIQIIHNEYVIRDLYYSSKYQLFNVYDNGNINTAIDVDYWAEMPKFWEE